MPAHHPSADDAHCPRRRQALGLAASACLSTVPAGALAMGAAVTEAPLFAGLDGHDHPVDSPLARVRRYVRQGVMLVYGFNAEEAVRSLEAAVALDPRCAGAWWALAWAQGPNINSDMTAQAGPRVQVALQQARRHANTASPLQRELIRALSRRHPPAGVLDEPGYAQACEAVARRHPGSALAQLLAAEAQLNLHPYDWWQADGSPMPWTPRIVAGLRRSLQLDPRQPGAHHYAIHLYESSRQPQQARASADFLRTAFPGSGHLLHMPSHIDMRTGDYGAAIVANRLSIAADQAYLAQVDAQGAYRVAYVAHNHHFLWAAAGMAGRQSLALQAARDAWPAACGPARRDPGTALVQHYAVLPLFTLLRFGRWRELLHDTSPPDSPTPYGLAIWHFARGMARLRGGDAAAARAELARVLALQAEPALQGVKIKNLNAAASLVAIAVLTLRAELAQASGDDGAAVALLRECTALEDALDYDEPHLWYAPTRHALGAALLAAGQPAQAAAVYRQDLSHYPGNGWSLKGLSVALQQLRQPQAAREADQAAQAAQEAFAGAEQVPPGSRF